MSEEYGFSINLPEPSINYKDFRVGNYIERKIDGEWRIEKIWRLYEDALNGASDPRLSKIRPVKLTESLMEEAGYPIDRDAIDHGYDDDGEPLTDDMVHLLLSPFDHFFWEEDYEGHGCLIYNGPEGKVYIDSFHDLQNFHYFVQKYIQGIKKPEELTLIRIEVQYDSQW